MGLAGVASDNLLVAHAIKDPNIHALNVTQYITCVHQNHARRATKFGQTTRYNKIKWKNSELSKLGGQITNCQKLKL